VDSQPPTGPSQRISGQSWRFAECEFDERRHELRVRGTPVEVEAKPLEVLHQLLLHAGEVVTKEELLDSVWPGVLVVDGSLATAISKLRRALGNDDGIVVTLPRIGYRLGVPVHRRSTATPAWPGLDLEPGEPVPGRDQWRLTRRLALSPSGEIWLAEHPKTHEARVFKFARDAHRLEGLKREVTVARLLRQSLGERADFVRVLEWNFDSEPYFVESEYSGPNLADWAEAQAGLGSIPMDVRLRLLADVAKAVAAAHGVDVLHRDLKPGNILVTPASDGGWQIRVADFGSASLAEPSRLDALGITNLGFADDGSPGSDAGQALRSTLMYVAPEMLAGQSPSASADVYALGVLLYQLVVCDFRKPLSPGWEAEISDPLIREDIADAACGDPARRLASATALAERLLNLDSRRTERAHVEEARRRTANVERKLSEARIRRPWLVVAAVLLAVGVAASLSLYNKASSSRDLQDILNLQSDLARQISREIKITVQPSEDKQLASSGRVNPQAHELYLRGRFFWNRRTRDDLYKAAEFFRQATVIDPSDALAYAGVADAYVELVGFGNMQAAEGVPKAKAAAAKAIELNESLAEPHAALAYGKAEDWDWPGAQKEFRRALDLNPGYVTALYQYGFFLSIIGKQEEAISSIQRALELDPLSPIVLYRAGRVYYQARRYDKALEQFNRILELNANDPLGLYGVGLAYEAQGKFDQAIPYLQKESLQRGFDVATAYAAAGQMKEARRTLADEMRRQRAQKLYIRPGWVAEVYAGLGEKDEAFRWLERAYNERDAWLTLLKVWPPFDALRSDPRLDDLLRRMNFPS
jgi:DNA-binding winged helix-turn-helix (wHTH) protein/serine/threonine protein kinase